LLIISKLLHRYKINPACVWRKNFLSFVITSW